MLAERHEIGKGEISQTHENKTADDAEGHAGGPVERPDGRMFHGLAEAMADKGQREGEPGFAHHAAHQGNHVRPEIETGKRRRHPGEDGERLPYEPAPGGIDHRQQDDEDDQAVQKGEGQTHCVTLARRVGSGANLRRSATLVISVNARPATSAFVPAGTKAFLNPSLAASFSRASACGTGRMSPERLISPKKTLSRGK